jgi:hypothetical protein
VYNVSHDEVYKSPLVISESVFLYNTTLTLNIRIFQQQGIPNRIRIHASNIKSSSTNMDPSLIDTECKTINTLVRAALKKTLEDISEEAMTSCLLSIANFEKTLDNYEERLLEVLGWVNKEDLAPECGIYLLICDCPPEFDNDRDLSVSL